jgi:hypothetical protein
MSIGKGATMLTLLDHLREFNRKERFYFIGMALGNTNFRLSREFRKALGDALELRVPEDAFAAMDYHLDWIAASLHLAAYGDRPGPYLRDPRLVAATQEDVDLVVAYPEANSYHLIMLEAKGVTAYSNGQFRSKIERLNAVFFEGGAAKSARAIPHFALVSPREPLQLDYSKCAPWMLAPNGRVAWLRLKLPPVLKKVFRCYQDGKISQQGNHWKVVPERRAG